MEFTELRAVESLFAMLSQGVRNIHAYNRSVIGYCICDGESHLL